MAALGNRTQRILQLESSMGVVECRSTLCIQLFKQGPSMRGCSRYGGSRGCWGVLEHRRPWSRRFQSSYTSPLVVHSGTLMIGNESMRWGGKDRNTDADRSRVFWYVTSTQSESRRPSSQSGLTEWAQRIYGPAGSRTVWEAAHMGWVVSSMPTCMSGRDFDVNRWDQCLLTVCWL